MASNPLDSMPNVGPNPLDSMPNVGSRGRSFSPLGAIERGAGDVDRIVNQFVEGGGAAVQNATRNALSLINRGAAHGLIPKARAPASISGQIGSLVGTALPYVAGDVGAASAIGALGAASRAAPAVADAVASGAVGYGTSAHDRLLNGALTGALSGAGAYVPKAVRALLTRAAHAVDMFTDAGVARTAARKIVQRLADAGLDPAEVAAKASGARPDLPGEVPSLHDAAPGPRTLAVQNQLSNAPRSGAPLAERRAANDAARLRLVRQVAHEKQDLVHAKGLRDAHFQPMRDKLNSARVSPKRLIRTYRAVAAQFAGVPEAETELSALKRLLEKGVGVDGKVPANAIQSFADRAHELRATLLLRADPKKEAALAVKSIGHAAKRTLRDEVPGYAEAARRFARESGPIDAMEAGQAILEDAARRGQNANEEPFLRLQDLNRVLHGDEGAEFPIPAQARARLLRVRKSLVRSASDAAKVGVPGNSQTAAFRNASRILSSPWGMRYLGAAAGGALGSAAGGHEAGAQGYELGAIAGLGLGFGFEPEVARVLSQRGLLVAEQEGALAADASKAAEAIRSVKAEEAALARKASARAPVFVR